MGIFASPSLLPINLHFAFSILQFAFPRCTPPFQPSLSAPLRYAPPVRKRLIIGATIVAAMVIAIAAYALSRPKEGTARWYVEEYIDATGKMRRRLTPFDKLYRKVETRLLGRRSQASLTDFTRSDEALRALHNLGFLAVREFPVTNLSQHEIAGRVWKRLEPDLPPEEALFLKFHYTNANRNVLVIEGVASQMHKWEAAIREADVATTR